MVFTVTHAILRYTMICNTSSQHFQTERQSDLLKVSAKMDELGLALYSFTSVKFCNRHETDILEVFKEMTHSEVKYDLAKASLAVKTFDAVLTFQPFAKQLVVKALGETNAAKFNQYLQDNKDFYTKFQAAIPVLIPLLQSEPEVNASTLLNEKLQAFMEVFKTETVLANVRKMVPKIAPSLTQLGYLITKAAKLAVGRDASSVIKFLAAVKDEAVEFTAIADKDLVGAVLLAEGEPLKATKFGKIFELYLKGDDTCEIEKGSDKITLSTSALCAGMSLHHLLGHLVQLKDILDQSEVLPAIASKLAISEAPKLYEGSKLQHLVATWNVCRTLMLRFTLEVIINVIFLVFVAAYQVVSCKRLCKAMQAMTHQNHLGFN